MPLGTSGKCSSSARKAGLTDETFPGEFPTFAENPRKCRDFRDFLHFREFPLQNQEPGEKCKKLATTGVQTPG
jgi:hypothetical protein